MHFKESLIRYLKQLASHLEGKNKLETSVFDDLSPIDNVPNMGTYDQALS